MSPPEAKLWVLLRTEPFRIAHFRRQVPLGPYYADFASHTAKLVIEVDGSQHFDDAAIAPDARRQSHLERQGYRVLRFNTVEILQHIEVVGAAVLAAIDS